MMMTRFLQLSLLLLPAAVCSWAFTALPSRRTSPIALSSVSKSPELWKVEKVDHISEWTSDHKSHPNPLSLKDNIPSAWFVGLNDAVALKVQIDALETIDETCVLSSDDDCDDDDEECIVGRGGINAEAFILAGPRAEISFDPSTSKAAIVTCGGLCPGLNTVVRELAMCLSRQYGVQEIVGIPQGYRGFLYPEEWKSLDETVVQNLHNQGGSMLGSSRGGHDTDAIVDSLVNEGIVDWRSALHVSPKLLIMTYHLLIEHSGLRVLLRRHGMLSTWPIRRQKGSHSVWAWSK